MADSRINTESRGKWGVVDDGILLVKGLLEIVYILTAFGMREFSLGFSKECSQSFQPSFIKLFSVVKESWSASCL